MTVPPPVRRLSIALDTPSTVIDVLAHPIAFVSNPTGNDAYKAMSLAERAVSVV
jgi:hypothetical protein